MTPLAAQQDGRKSTQCSCSDVAIEQVQRAVSGLFIDMAGLLGALSLWRVLLGRASLPPTVRCEINGLRRYS